MSLVKAILDDGRIVTAGRGTSLDEIIGREKDGERILAAAIDHLVVPLSHPLLRDGRVSPIVYGAKEGIEVYRRTLTFILAAAVHEVYPERSLVIGHSLSGGYYYDLLPGGADGETIGRIAEKVRELIEADLPLIRSYIAVSDARRHFEEAGRSDKALLLSRIFSHTIEMYRLGNYFDSTFGPLAPTTGAVPNFKLAAYSPGFVMRFPSKKDLSKFPAVADQTRLFQVYHESKRWSKILEIENVGRLNEVVAEGRFRDCVQVAEGLHEKKIVKIADLITERSGDGTLVLISGPSSSGKTSFAKRLGVQLRVNGIDPIPLHLDDYFVDREKTPKDKNGEYDFECLEALDLPLLNEHLVALLDGKEVATPRFDFKTGRRSEEVKPIRLKENSVLILEGIHGLNDALTPGVPASRKVKIYISALTQLSIDNHNRIPTTDTRLIRRMVRDKRFRGYSAVNTLERWPSVIRGEGKHIFPYQESADQMFNSALLYEMAVLKPFARRALEEVPPEEKVFAEAQKLLSFLNLFIEADPDPVPPTSILREFIGGSSFRY